MPEQPKPDEWARSFAEANIEIENHLPVGFFRFRTWAEKLPDGYAIHVKGGIKAERIGEIAGIPVFVNPDCPPDKVYAFRLPDEGRAEPGAET